MDPDRPSETRTRALAAAVYIGAVVLVAIPSTFVLSSLFVGFLEPVVDSLGASELWLLTAPALALLVGLQLAAEAAELRLHGIAALRRDGRRLLRARHTVLAVSSAFVFGLVTWYGLSFVFDGSSWFVAALAGLVALAAVSAIVHKSDTLVVQYRSDENRL